MPSDHKIEDINAKKISEGIELAQQKSNNFWRSLSHPKHNMDISSQKKKFVIQINSVSLVLLKSQIKKLQINFL